MPTVHCPNCQKPLNLPDSLRGCSVCCPHCQTIFTAPTGEAASSWPEPRPAPAAGQTQGPASDFNFQEEETGRASGRRRLNRKTMGPANWLKTAAIIEIVLGSLCLGSGVLVTTGGLFAAGAMGALGNMLEQVGPLVVILALFLGGGILLIGIAVVVLLGALALARQKNYGLALTGSILALLLGIKSLLQTAFAGWAVLGTVVHMNCCAFLLAGTVFGLVLTATIGEFTGGIQALLALSDEEVKEAFR